MVERNTPPPGWAEAGWGLAQEIDLNTRRSMGKYIFVNSWHENDSESLAMWKLYDPTGYGIAVVSSFDRLRSSLAANEEIIYVGGCDLT